jgi:hypothetical protein
MLVGLEQPLDPICENAAVVIVDNGVVVDGDDDDDDDDDDNDNDNKD